MGAAAVQAGENQYDVFFRGQGPSPLKPYEFIPCGAIDVTKPYKFIELGAINATKPQKRTRFVADGQVRRQRLGMARQ